MESKEARQRRNLSDHQQGKKLLGGVSENRSEIFIRLNKEQAYNIGRIHNRLLQIEETPQDTWCGETRRMQILSGRGADSTTLADRERRSHGKKNHNLRNASDTRRRPARV